MALLLLLVVLPAVFPTRVAHRIALKEVANSSIASIAQELAEAKATNLEDNINSASTGVPVLLTPASSIGFRAGAKLSAGSRVGRAAGHVRPVRVAETNKYLFNSKLEAAAADNPEAHNADASSGWQKVTQNNRGLVDLITAENSTVSEPRHAKKPKKKNQLYDLLKTQSKFSKWRPPEHQTGGYGIYEKGKLLGKGGYGEVYEGRILDALAAVEHNLPEKIAIKVIQTKDAEERTIAKREFAMQVRFQHPNIVKAYDVYETNSAVNLVMECLDGPKTLKGAPLYSSPYGYGGVTLRAEIQSKKKEGESLGYARSLEVFKQLVKAVVYLHSRGICHKDLKPGNTFLVDEHIVKIGDFGRSFDMKLVDSPMNSTKIGTRGYWPPEIRKSQYDAREYDLWSLGVMLYEMLTGHRPFTEAQLRSQFLGASLELPLNASLLSHFLGVGGLSAPLIELLEGLLSFSPEKRSRGKALIHALQRGGLLHPLELCEGWESVLSEGSEYSELTKSGSDGEDHEHRESASDVAGIVDTSQPSIFSLALPVNTSASD